MKRLLSFCILLCCVTAAAMAYDRPPVDWNIAFSAVSYGSKDIRDVKSSITSGSYTHMTLSGALGTSGKFDENLFGTLSFTPVADFYTSDVGEAVFLDWCGNAGLRLYPGLGGMNLGVEYSLGIRQDYSKIGSDSANNAFTPWGNGFRFIAEYDFSEDTEGFAPMVGLSWRHMPRGNNVSDNIFSLYLSFHIK